MASDKKMREEILRIVAGTEKGLTQSAVLNLLGNCDVKRFRRLFRELLQTDQLTTKDGKRFILPPPEEFPEGRLQTTPQGFGFVTLTGKHVGEPDVFIPPGQLGPAITGDFVQIAITDPDNPRGPVGEIREILQRKFEEIVGCLVPHGRGWAIRPLRRELPALINLHDNPEKPSLTKCKEGDWIKATLHNGPQGEEALYAKLSSRIASSGTVTADLNAIVKEFGIPAKYNKREEEAAAADSPVPVTREDQTALLAVTIDPVDARDYDDALSYTPGPGANECTIGVHIADVACYVPRKSRLDKMALKRGFTSYLPGRTLPMLPATLANDLCSLRAGVPRMAHTVFIRIAKKSGKILSWRRAHTEICVAKRLCYDDVTRVFEGEDIGLSPEICEMLQQLGGIAEKLRQQREKHERFLPMEMPEIRVLCSEHPSQIIGMQRTEHSASHALVEEFMLAANQCVAKELQEKKIPGLFRNHPAMEESSMAQFLAETSHVLGTRLKPIRNRKQLVDFISFMNHHPLQEMLQMTFLRQLPRANYGAKCEGHFGLGKDDYCHFTSPIRRYPDLLVHQQLLAFDRQDDLLTQEQVATLAETCSALEENCDQASFAASDRMKMRFLIKQKDDNPMLRLSGCIIRITKNGLAVFLTDYSLMGFVPAWLLPKQSWRFYSKELQWRNHQTGEVLQNSQSMDFLIHTIDPVRGELNLMPLFRQGASSRGKKSAAKSAVRRRRRFKDEL